MPLLESEASGAWTVPKGLIRPGESPLSAAEREFAEETSNLAYYERRARDVQAKSAVG